MRFSPGRITEGVRPGFTVFQDLVLNPPENETEPDELRRTERVRPAGRAVVRLGSRVFDRFVHPLNDEFIKRLPNIPLRSILPASS